MKKVDFGHPWGKHAVTSPVACREIPAACPSNDHSNCVACSPHWEEVAAKGRLIDGPHLLPEGWRALVEFPDPEVREHFTVRPGKLALIEELRLRLRRLLGWDGQD